MKLWNPFSKKAKDLRQDAREDKQAAFALHERAVKMKAYHEEIYHEQKQLSEALRKEQRKNHFSDLFQTAVPLRNPDTE